MPYAILISVALIFLVLMPAFFRLQKQGRKGLSLVFKAASTLIAAGFALHACLQGADAYAALILAGLCVCVLADVVLDIRFVAGGALFFAGHVLYVTALGLYRQPSWWCLTVFVLAGGGLAFFGSHYRADAPAKHLVICAAIYGVALAALLGFSIPLPFLAFSRRSLLAALGAALFVASDLTLCHNILRDKPVPYRFVSLGMYYMGQLLLGLSAFSA